MERQLDSLVRILETSDSIQREILGKLEGTINRKFIVKINADSCFGLLKDNLTRININSYDKRVFGLENNVVKISHNNNLNHICICFQTDCYLEIIIIPIEKDISEIHIKGINIQMDYFQDYLQIINNILKK